MRNSLVILLATLLLSPIGASALQKLPESDKVELEKPEPVCGDEVPPEWRKAQTIAGVSIQESIQCQPDNPAEIAAFVKGTNNIPMDLLMETQLAADALIKTNDMDNDGDPDHIIIKLEIAELNGHSPDMTDFVTTFDIASGLQPAFWVFAPKTRDMSTADFLTSKANPLLRAPSPAIRVEQDDVVWLVLENTHYLPHSIHLHGVDHPFMDHSGSGNDGVGQTSAMDVMPGETKTYVIRPRVPGTMYYHCHVQPHTHIPMGLQGLFIVEENRPNNWLQTFNVGNGQVRHPSVASQEKYLREYDLHYQSLDKELHQIVQSANDPRLIARRMNLEYDITEASDDYFILNGRAFPYTLRESMIVMERDKKVKLRVLNGHTETLALHIHGHKPMATHYDGVDNGPATYIKRDVHGMAPAQRLDLELSGVDNGLDSFGQGIWMFHDHVEKAFTTNGIGEGGSISLVVYKDYITANGIPKSHGMSLEPYFSKTLWQGQYPLWQNYDAWSSLGLPKLSPNAIPIPAAKTVTAPASMSAKATSAPSAKQTDTNAQPSGFWRLLKGLVIGLILYPILLHVWPLIASRIKSHNNQTPA